MGQDMDLDAGRVRVFRAGPSDLPLARRGIADVHGRRLETDDATAAFLSDDTCYLHLAVAGDEVVGSLNGYRLTHPHTRRPQFLLYEIDVAAPWRRRGIGASLVRAFIEEARIQDAFGFWVVTDRANTAAMALYRSCDLTSSDLEDVVLSLGL